MRIISGLDTETTGLKQESGDKIIEVCFCLYNLDTRDYVGKYVQRINPQRSISEEAQRVHGISINDLTDSPVWDDVATKIATLLRKSTIVVAHNAGFDLPFIANELDRIGLEVPNVEVFDTMTNARWATFNGKLPKLQELCFALGVEYDPSKAHSAEYDVNVMMDCLWEGIDRGFYTLPEV